MVDWITCRLWVDSLPEFGLNIKSDHNGEIIMTSSLPRSVSSGESNIYIAPYGDDLTISGNPSKYAQGHNVIAIDQWSIVENMLQNICSELNITNWKLIKITRLDITHSIIFDSESDIETTLLELSKTTGEKWGKPVTKSGTVYFGHPKRQQLVIYSKAPEFKRRNRKTQFCDIELPPILRLEVRLGRNWFNENDWHTVIDDTYRLNKWNEMIDRIRINDIESVNINEIPRKLQKILGLWKLGVDLRTVYSIGTLYNYASEMRKFGIDIWQPYHESKISQFKKTLNSRPLTLEDIEALKLPIWKAA